MADSDVDSTMSYHVIRKFEEVDARLDALEAVAPASENMEASDSMVDPSSDDTTETTSTRKTRGSSKTTSSPTFEDATTEEST